MPLKNPNVYLYACLLTPVSGSGGTLTVFCSQSGGHGGHHNNPYNIQKPLIFGLEQNYPNPFNPSTTIKFDITRQSYTKLIIYDVLGREVAKLIDEKMDAGSYDKTWDAAQYASGTYIYKIEAGDYSSVKKMMLVK